MNDYIVTLNHHIYVNVFADSYCVHARRNKYLGYVDFFIDNRVTTGFSVNDVVCVEVVLDDDSLEKVFVKE